MGGSGRGCPTCRARGGGGGATQHLWLKMIPTSRILTTQMWGGGEIIGGKNFFGPKFVFLCLRRQHPFLHKTNGPTRNPFSPTPPPLLRRASMSPPPPPPRSAILRSPWTPRAAQRHRSGPKRCGDAHREGGAVGYGGALCGRAPAVWVVDRHRPQSRLVGAGPPRGRGRNECTTDSDSIVRSSCPARTRHRPEPCTEGDGVHAKGSPGSPCTTRHEMGGNGGNGEGKFLCPGPERPKKNTPSAVPNCSPSVWVWGLRKGGGGGRMHWKGPQPTPSHCPRKSQFIAILGVFRLENFTRPWPAG